MNRVSRVRPILACIGLVSCFTVFSGRLVNLQVTRHEEYANLAMAKHVSKQPIHAMRGTITDTRGEILAVSEPLRVVVADGSRMRDIPKAAAILAEVLEMDEQDILRKVTPQKRYVVLKRKVPEATGRLLEERLKSARVSGGIQYEPDFKRIYPNEGMLCHVLGFLNHESAGVQGIEMTMDHYLRGRDGFRIIERNREGAEIVPYRRHEREARNGYNVRLTIDMSIQSFVEQELDAAFAEYHPEMATAIVMEPKTGRILAMANRPFFNPNKPGEGEPAGKKNAAIINLVEPGSTFKIVTVAASLNEGKVTPQTIINVENGRFHYAGKILRDHGHGPFPNLSVSDVLVKSSNIGVAKMAMMMGEHRFYEYVRRFGFGERTGINLPGEIPGIVHPPYRWSKISISRIPMGQGVATTPLQMIVALSAIANGGKLMMPQIVEDVRDADGTPIVSFNPVVVREVVDREVTDMVKLALRDVVSRRGTANRASVPGYTAAGKTGTAEKASPNGGYMKGHYVTSFVGFMPAEDPKLACIVLLDDAQVAANRNYGGVLAAPVFSRIAERTARYWGLPPQFEVEEVPDENTR